MAYSVETCFFLSPSTLTVIIVVSTVCKHLRLVIVVIGRCVNAGRRVRKHGHYYLNGNVASSYAIQRLELAQLHKYTFGKGGKYASDIDYATIVHKVFFKVLNDISALNYNNT